MIQSKTRRGGLFALAFAGALVAVPEANAQYADFPYVRGEAARLQRQAYDYYYRNSNRNVFRSSRHFHPTRNVFRSSRHYLQRLAASYDGFPLRTTVNFTEHTADGPVLRSYSFAYPRRSPLGPVGFALEDPYYDLDRYGTRGRIGAPVYENRAKGSNAILILPDRGAEEPREPIEMVNISAQVRPTQRAVLKQMTQPDGTVRTIITSEPVDAPVSDTHTTPTLDRAWKLVKLGDFEPATEAFLAFVDDAERGAEAMLGYAVARAGQGDAEAARHALRRALEADPEVLDDAPMSDAIRDLLADIEAPGIKN